MRREDPNFEYLLVVASALGDLRDEIVLGCDWTRRSPTIFIRSGSIDRRLADTVGMRSGIQRPVETRPAFSDGARLGFALHLIRMLTRKH